MKHGIWRSQQKSMLDLASVISISFINQHIPCLCTGVCVGVLRGIYAWIASIGILLHKLWANNNCCEWQSTAKTRAKSWSWSRAQREGQEESWEESEVFRVLREAAMFQTYLKGLRLEAGVPKRWLAGESWALVPEWERAGGFRGSEEGEALCLEEQE